MKLFLCSAVFLASYAATQAAVVWSDDFTTTWTASKYTSTVGGTPVTSNAIPTFADGVFSDYYAVITGSSFRRIANTTLSGNVYTASFDFFLPSASTGTFRIGFGKNNDLNTGNTGVYKDISSSSFSTDTVYGLSIIFNKSGSSINYNDLGGTSQSLAGGYADIWLYDYITGASTKLETKQQDNTGATQLILRSFSGNDSMNISLDNLKVYNEAILAVTPVPEPSTYALVAGVVALGSVVMVRRRNTESRAKI